MITALRATSQTLASLLTSRFKAEPSLAALFGPGGATISLSTPDELARRREFGLSLWLYRVVRDEQTLNEEDERVGTDQWRRAPLPVRLHYLMTPMLPANAAQAPETEQHILGVVLQTFHDHAQLSGPDLAGDLRGTNAQLFVRLETLSLEEITRIWDSIEHPYQLCVSYETAVVEIASRHPDALDRPVMVPQGLAGLIGATP